LLLVKFDENAGDFDHGPSPPAPSLHPDGSPAGKTPLPEADIAFERFTHPKPPGTKSQPQPDARVYGPGVRVPLYVI
ncbi:alkaline phosphatase family protein, partial [Burkholderia pseudomallei]